MNRFALILAGKYLSGAKRKKSISTMVGVSFIGIMIGSFALMLTLAIMNGFEQATYDKLQSIHAPIIMRAFGNPLDFKALKKVINDEFPEVTALAAVNTQQVMIQNREAQDISSIVAIKGIQPEQQRLVTSLEHKLVSSPAQKASNLPDIVHGKRILIGEKLACSLDLQKGDPITLLYTPDEPRRKKIHLTQHKAIVGGFFKTGIEEFDANLAFASIHFVQELFPDSGITQVQLTIDPNYNEQEIIEQLRHRLHIEVYSWKDLYPALVSALKLEKYVMFIILALITLIASMNVISLLFMHIHQKKADIAILGAMGMSKKDIRTIFTVMGLFIAGTAAACGITLSLITCWLLKKYPLIELPDAYLVSHVPVSWHWGMPLGIFLLALVLTLIATWIPLRRTEHVSITEILRYNT